MERVLLLLLALLMVAAAALLQWGPVQRYVVACERGTRQACTLERHQASGTQRWQVTLAADAVAAVQVVPRTRGKTSVYLYLHSAGEDVFAAEFEGQDAPQQAAAAADQLNRAFRSRLPAPVRIEVRPPAYLRWMAWGGIAFMALLLAATYRELKARRQRPAVPDAPHEPV